MNTRSLTELVERIEQGEEGAWVLLVRRLTPAVQSAVRRYDVEDELRKDAIAETWRVLFERLGTVQDPERLHKWIYVVASNRLLSMLRRSERTREVVMGNDVIDVCSPTGDDDRLVDAEIRAVLDGAVSQLTAKEQTVVRCRAFTDQPVPLRSIECRYGIPAGSVGPTLGRGIRKLRQDPGIVGFFADRGGQSLTA